MTFSKILIANRGEIAVRIQRTAQALGYKTVAVYSDVDADAPHVAMADEAVLLGPAPVQESYLRGDKIIAACNATGADAVHPGYGLLAENPDFADALTAAGIRFIGPGAAAIRAMGDKAAAKRLMQDAGVRCLPGYDGADQNMATLADEARNIGFPLMVKAVAGGGGRGMRLVRSDEELADALQTANSEAQSAFGDSRLLLERALIGARHIEIQVFTDSAGNTVHLGKRDCSIQRHHQKLFEESPSPVVTRELRDRMGAAAVAAATAIDYEGAGTVEFLCDADGEFYFLEMNTRLQVEHPVTEMLTRIDLVAWQIAIAEGKPLPVAQAEIEFQGHAIEARLCAEAPGDAFRPQTGTVEIWSPAYDAGLRVDAGVASGTTVSRYYDSMIAKVIAHGATREAAVRTLRTALQETRIYGLKTNLRFLIDCLQQPLFLAGQATTAFIDEAFGRCGYQEPAPDDHLVNVAAALLYRAGPRNWPHAQTGFASSCPIETPMAVVIDDNEPVELEIAQLGPEQYRVTRSGGSTTLQFENATDSDVQVVCEGVRENAFAAVADERIHIAYRGNSVSVRDALLDPPTDADTPGSGKILAPMDGVIVAVSVAPETPVKQGDLLLILEAMKMQHRIVADVDGTVIQVIARAGEQVAMKNLLVEIERSP